MAWHTAHHFYEPGDVVAPGRWGCIVVNTGQAHPAYEREQLLEKVRRQVAPILPSRLIVAFGHAEFAAAEEYAEAGERLYEVQALGPVAELDMVWITWIRESLAVSDVEKASRRAALYWHGHPTSAHLATARPHWELLARDGWLVQHEVLLGTA